MKIFPLSTKKDCSNHPYIWTIAKPTNEFMHWLITQMPQQWWMDYNESVKKLLDQRQVDPKIIYICLNEEGVAFLKLRWMGE